MFFIINIYNHRVNNSFRDKAIGGSLRIRIINTLRHLFHDFFY
ncbi:hypothetical protein YPPY14_2899, partial [Yersinia pestis PY-14]